MLDHPMKECPDCKAEIRADAKVCRYCQHRFGGARRALVGGGMAVVLVVAIIAAAGGRHQAGAAAGPAATSASPPSAASDIKSLLVSQAKLDEACRGGNVGPDSPVCRGRDAADRQLSEKGWCIGEPGDFAADETWHECVAAEAYPISKRHRDWIEQCEDAVRNGLNDPRSADFPNPTSDARLFIHSQNAEPDAAAAAANPATMDAWTKNHPEAFSETVTFGFHAKNMSGGVQRYTASCTFADNFDGTTKMTRHAAGTD